jgi:hypothetical protein
MNQVKEDLAARPLQHLQCWKTTYGGDEFMPRGMLSYWKDPIESPRRLISKGAGHQRKFGPEQEEEFYKMLKEQIDEKIIVEVPNDWPAFTSPVHTVPKKGNEWRMVWDGREVNAEQVSIHFRMEGPETVQYLMERGDWATSIDLRSAFNHVWVSKETQRFLCFRYGASHTRTWECRLDPSMPRGCLPKRLDMQYASSARLGTSA